MTHEPDQLKQHGRRARGRDGFGPSIPSVQSRSFVSVTMLLVVAFVLALVGVGAYQVAGPVSRAEAAPGDPILCSAGIIYALDGNADGTSANGAILQVNSSTGASTVVGQFPSTPSQQINALAIPAGGGAVYALRATATAGQLQLLKYTTATNSSAVLATVASPHGYVAGAIDPTTGLFWWAGVLSNDANTWGLSAYNLATGTDLGLQFTTPSNGGINGDLAFDNQGRLYLVTSAGNGTAANNQLRYYDAPLVANGSSVAGTLLTNPAPFTSAFNGVAFGADGFLYTEVGGASGSSNRVIYKTNPSSGAVTSSVTLTRNGTPDTMAVDLASCASPSTLEVVKNIAGRYNPGDQFALSATGPNVTENNTGVTSGSTTGLQTDPSEIAGPVLVVPGSSYNFAETGAAGAELGNYTESYQCVDQGDNNTVLAEGTTTSGTVSIPSSPAGGAAVVCTFTNTPFAPAYTVAKTASGSVVDPGDTVTYTVTVHNTGDQAYTAANPASFTDDLSQVLDDASYNNDATNGATVTGNTLSWSGALPLNGTVTITYSVTVGDPDAGDGTLTNAVVPTGRGGSCPTAGDCTTTVQVRSYTVSKTVDRTQASPGQVVSYIITVENSGQGAYTAADPASFTDDLSSVLDDASYNGDASSGATVTGNILSWSGALPVGGSATIIYSVTVDDPDGGDHLLTNAVVPTGPGGSCTTADGCTTTVPVGSIHVTKTTTAPNAEVTPGEVVPYTITITNTGQVAYTDANPASITDDLSAVIDDASYDNNVASSAGSASYAAPVISWSGPIGIGGTVTITYSVTVNDPDAGDHHLLNSVVTPPGLGNCPTGSDDPDCTVEVPSSSFTVAKTASETTAVPGDTVTYTITVHNTGGIAYTVDDPASFTDDLSRVLDDASYNGDADNGATVTGSTLSWSGALPVGGTVTITYSVTVKDPDTGDHTLTNAVRPTSPGGSCDPDGTCTTTTPVAGYTVNKVASAASANPGDTITYTVTVTNTGAVAYTDAAPASFTDDLSKVLDDAVYNGDASNGATVAGNALSWSGALPIGGTATVTYSVTVKDPDTGDHTLTNAVVPTGPGGDCATSGDCTTTTPVAGYTVEKTASATSAQPGDTVVYTIVVTNIGQLAYTAANPAALTDDLSAVLDDARYNNDADNGATVTGSVLSWSGALPVGGAVTITYSVTVNDPDPGDQTLSNAVVPTAPGGDCAAPGDCSTTIPVASYTVAKTASATSAQPGDSVSYTVTVVNTSDVAYTTTAPASFTDDLSAVLDDATYNGDASNGATVSGNTLSWSGALPAHGTVTVTYSVTVDSPDSGDGTLTNAVVPTGPGGSCDTGGSCTTTTPVASYTVAKSVSATSAVPGEIVTYTVTVTNTSDVAYTTASPASFTDDLSEVLDDASYNGDADNGAVVAGSTLSWSGALPANGIVVVTYSVTVDDPDTGDHLLSNAVAPTGPGGDCDAAGDCTTTTPIASYTVAKTASAANVLPGGIVAYTVTVTNTGAVAYTDAAPASFTDDLSAVLDDATYNNDASDGAAVAGNTLSWSGALPVAGSVVITYSVTVNNPDAGDHVLNNAVVPTGPGGDCTAPADCTTTTPVASYTVAKTASVTTAVPGDTVAYTVTVTNTGAVAYTTDNPAAFTDDLSAVLDDARYNGDATNGATVSGSTLSWSGALGIGDTATITYSVTVDDPDAGDHVLSNAVVPTGPGGSCEAAGDCATTTPVASLHVMKTTTATAVAAGEVVPYTITITNTGQVAYTDAAPASFTDDLTAVLDDATYNNDAASSSGAGVSYAAPVISWSGALGIGDTVTITYSVTVNTPDTGDHQLANTVVTPPGTGANCPPDSTDPSCVANVPAASFTVAKTASATTALPGDTVSYTVIVQNTGKVAYTDAAPASFTDDLSRVLDDAVYNGDADNGATVTGSTLSWSGALPVGGTVVVTYSVTVSTPDAGDHLLTNAVVPTAPGGSCDAPGDCTTTTPVAGYTVAKAVDATLAQSGQKVTYTITVTNTGAVAYTADKPASLTDDLSEVLDDAVYNGDADNGATVTGSTLSWSGALPVGSTVQISYSVTVNTPDKGDHELGNAVVPTDPSGSCAAPGACMTSTPILGYIVHKTASAAAAVPGQKITYKITVTNTGKADYTAANPASFGDDLSNALKLADYDGDADNGAVYNEPVLSWAGALPVGGSVTVSYTMTVTQDASGKITNVVVTPPASGANCGTGSDDPDCTAITTVTPPPPGAAVHTGGYLIGAGIPVWMWISAGWLALIGASAIGFLVYRRRSSES